MNEFLRKLIARKKTELKVTEARFEKSQDEAEIRALGATLEALKNEIIEAESQLKELEGEGDEASGNDGADEGAQRDDGDEQGDNNARSTVPVNAELRGAQVIASYRTGSKADNADGENYKYRNAFMEYVLRNKPIPAELRDNTNTSDIASVIPTQLVNQIIEKFDTVSEGAAGSPPF